VGVHSRGTADPGRRRASPVKKTYAPPVLVPWGTLRNITQHVGDKGQMDG